MEGRDINVVVRARPLLEHEVNAGYFEVTHAQNKSFYFLEPKISTMKQGYQIQPDESKVDFAYSGAQHDNQKIFEEMMIPLIDLNLVGGIGTIFSYGQTGSGKTFTIQGMITRACDALFERQTDA